MTKQRILILGGTGHYGREIVRSLVEKSVPVTVLTRNAARAKETIGVAPRFVEGDITAGDCVREALQGASALVIAVSAFSPDQIRRIKAVEQDAVIAALEEAQAAGVKRVVFVSVFEVKEDLARKHKIDSGNAKLEVERFLAGSDFNWTVLGAPPSMDIFFRMLRGKTLAVPGGGPEALPTIAPRDLGEIAARAVLRDDLARRRIRVVGEVLGFREAAERFSRFYGKPVKFRKIPLLLPRIARALTGILSPFSNRIYYVHSLLGFIKLLNQFPPEIAAQARLDLADLRRTFNFNPTTLELEAERRRRG